jgi:prolipoprotein diacylglyceryltransferase
MFDTHLPLYGLCIFISILAGLFVIYKKSYILKLNRLELLALILYCLLGAIFGAKYFTFMVNPGKFNYEFNFFEVGLSSYGAVIGILILLFIYSKQYKKDFCKIVNIIGVALPLMYAIGKIGCFLAGCCYGIEYNGLFSITYKYSLSAPNGISLFPIQIVETIVFTLIFLFNSYLFKKKDNNLIAYSFILCGFAKFLLDYLRNSHINVIISVNQIVSIAFILIGIILLIYKKRTK